MIAAVVHEKNVYVFTGGDATDRKQRELQLARIPLEGGPLQVLGKAIVAGNHLLGLSRTSFWTSPELFVTSTAIADGRLYTGTVTDGILAFPLAGGDPVRIGEKEGLPSPFVNR